jgi:hypothetical protein
MAILIVETTHEKPFTPELHGEAGKKLDPCLEAHGARWVRSYLSADKLRMVCHFEAPDAEAVRASYRTAEVKFDRCYSAELYTRSGAKE